MGCSSSVAICKDTSKTTVLLQKRIRKKRDRTSKDLRKDLDISLIPSVIYLPLINPVLSTKPELNDILAKQSSIDSSPLQLNNRALNLCQKSASFLTLKLTNHSYPRINQSCLLRKIKPRVKTQEEILAMEKAKTYTQRNLSIFGKEQQLSQFGGSSISQKKLNDQVQNRSKLPLIKDRHSEEVVFGLGNRIDRYSKVKKQAAGERYVLQYEASSRPGLDLRQSQKGIRESLSQVSLQVN